MLPGRVIKRGREASTEAGNEYALLSVVQEVLRRVDEPPNEAVRLQLLRRMIVLDRVWVEVLMQRTPMAPPPRPVAL